MNNEIPETGKRRLTRPIIKLDDMNIPIQRPIVKPRDVNDDSILKSMTRLDRANEVEERTKPYKHKLWCDCSKPPKFVYTVPELCHKKTYCQRMREKYIDDYKKEIERTRRILKSHKRYSL